MAGPGIKATLSDFLVKPRMPGRCAPTLLEDLVLYDPTRTSTPPVDLLQAPPTDILPHDAHDLRDIIPTGSCQHVFWLKERQSRLAPLDARPDQSTLWTVSAMCGRCCMHLHVKADYTKRWEPFPCPTGANPLHHLVHSDFHRQTEWYAWEKASNRKPAILHTFECTSKTCGVVVTVRLTPQHLQPNLLELLINQNLIKERTNAAFKAHEGGTQGMKQPASIDVISDLRAYIKNSWSQDEPRKIQPHNRRFVVRFGIGGEPCRELLEFLTFKWLDDESCWRVPMPDQNDKLPLENANNIFLDDIEFELLSLMHNRPVEEKQSYSTGSLDHPVIATQELSRILGSQSYGKFLGKRNDALQPPYRPHAFTYLGIPVDASDELIAYAYHCQLASDPNPQHRPVYLQHLKQISLDRNSEALSTETVVEVSKGRYDLDSLSEAFGAFGTTLSGHWERTDEDIIGSFQAVLMDSPKHETQLRQHLRRIGEWRNSSSIINIADDTMNTYEQALDFLDAQPAYADDQIVAMLTVKVNDNKALEEKARKAVRIIAQHRQSFVLDQWLNSGVLETPEMDVADAYATLQIDDRTCEDDWISMQYDVHKSDNPNNSDIYTRALTAIAKDRQSTFLQEKLSGTSLQAATYGNETEPVGLDNIGNTCYLNSLLQFLFTMVELRNIVLDFDTYKMSITDSNMIQKRVGQRQVTTREVQTAQDFVIQLAQLFNGMIESPSTAIRPDKELARLTLETHSAKEKIRRRSTLKGDRPSLGQMDREAEVLSPKTDTSLNAGIDDLALQPPGQVDTEMSSLLDLVEGDEQPIVEDTEMTAPNDNSSEATLVSTPSSEASPRNIETAETQQKIFDNKENLSPIKTDISPKHGDLEAEHPEPLAPASPSKINSQAGALAKQEVEVIPPTKPDVTFQPPPGKPPPVPPRKPVEPSTDILEEYARQQDVTEVIAHCLFQLSCAMRPTGKDEKTGEQLDEVHDMFFGSNLSHTFPEKEPPQSIQFFNVITRVSHKPADIYEALDTEYDLSEREGGSKAFMSISHLPPVFSVALDRVGWDNTAKRPIKHNDFVHVPETIYLDRYLSDSEGETDLSARRQQTWDLKGELAQLLERQAFLETPRAGTPNLQALLSSAKIAIEQLASIPVDTDSEDDENDDEPLTLSSQSLTTLNDLHTSIASEITSVNTRIASIRQTLKESFSSSHFQHHPYRLHAAFFHRGGPSGGHYWVYIYDHAKNLWRKYNDDRVNVVENLNDIFGKPREGEWTPPTPYFLVYVQADRVGELCQSVKRDVKFTSPEGPPPVPGNTHPYWSGGGTSQMTAMPPAQSHPALAGIGGFGRSGGTDTKGSTAEKGTEPLQMTDMIEQYNGFNGDPWEGMAGDLGGDYGEEERMPDDFAPLL